MATNIARTTALLIAVTGSVAVAALLAAASFGLWMPVHQPTPRINASTIAFTFVPVPALAWIVYLWVRTRPRRVIDFVLRIVVSTVLLLGAAYSLFVAMIDALFVG